MKTILLFMLCLVPSQQTLAAKEATEGRVDPRIKTVVYNERDVVVLHGHYGYSTHVIFAADEEIVHLSPGDSLAWQIVPKQNHLFLKPMENDADTNLSVLTNKRAYNFELRAHNASSSSDQSLSFAIQFHYPEEELQRAMAASLESNRRRDTEVMPGRTFAADTMNFDYTMRGADALAPTRVFDDGEFTYFQFPNEIDTPAIFLVDREKKEAIVNFHVRGKYIVVERIGSQFILRHGNLATCIYNETWQQRVAPSELPEAVSNAAEPEKATSHRPG